jgi:S-formylglutathione hydrolase FrmB
MVVMPDTGYAGWFTDWRNHGAGGPPRWETFHEASERYDALRIWGDPVLNRANWQANDPYVLAARLRGTGMYIASGLTGNPGPYDHPTPGNAGVEAQEIPCGATTVSFVKRLKALGIPATTHIYRDGWHDWSTWQPETHRAWPLMMTAIGASSTSGASAA